MIYLIAGLVLLAVVWAIWRYAMIAPPRTVARVLLMVALGVLVAITVALVAAGQSRMALWPGFLILPVLLTLFRSSRARRGPPVAASPGDADVSSMSREEAAEILGVSPDADRDEIIAAHARQKALREADGASRWATARLDRARDLLLRQRD